MLFGYLYLQEYIAGEMRNKFRELNSVLISIKNSLIAKQLMLTLKIRSTNPQICLKVLHILYLEGFILSYYYSKVDKKFIIYNNYYKNIPTLSIIKLFNKTSFPVYLKYTDLVTVHRFGVDLLLLSTTSGIMPHYEAIKKRLGGKLLCYIR
jgi:small subunit ribosomal protein S8